MARTTALIAQAKSQRKYEKLCTASAEASVAARMWNAAYNAAVKRASHAGKCFTHPALGIIDAYRTEAVRKAERAEAAYLTAMAVLQNRG